MIKRFLMSFLFFTLLISLWFQSAYATSPLEREFEEYLTSGKLSENFFASISEGVDPDTREAIFRLKAKEKNLSVCSNFANQKEMLTAELMTGWVGLISRIDGMPVLSLLCLNKLLSFEWRELHARDFANKCYRLVQTEGYSFKTKLCVAYRGLEALKVDLKSSDFNVTERFASVPEIIALLEGVKFLTASYQVVSELPWNPRPEFFHKECIPYAESYWLLMIIYGKLVAEEKGSHVENSRLMLRNGDHALAAYLKGLAGSSTLQQRKYYHAQVIVIGHDLRRRVSLFLREGDHDCDEIAKESSRHLARIFKDERMVVNQDDNLEQWYELTYKTALAYYFADKSRSALKYLKALGKVLYNEHHPSFNRLEYLKKRGENLKLKITDPDNALESLLDTADVFLN